jgi:septum formation protein
MYLLFLASGSPRRKELLEEAGFHPRLLLPKVSEIPKENMTPEEQISDISLRKLRGALDLLPQPRPKAIALSADTEVVFENRLLGKPENQDAAKETLRRLSGQTHLVITAVSLFETLDEKLVQLVDRTHVTFNSLSATDIEAYVRTGDPLDKAGSYGIQNIPKHFISSLQGSRSNVVGLPMEKLLSFFQEQKWIFQ